MTSRSGKSTVTIQRLAPADFTVLENPGKQSVQIVWPRNAPDALVTITRVTMAPGATSARHAHPHSEQIWLVEAGSGLLLLADGQTEDVREGDVVRTPPGTVHGVINTGSTAFVYLSVTTPPQDFTPAYIERHDADRPLPQTGEGGTRSVRS